MGEDNAITDDADRALDDNEKAGADLSLSRDHVPDGKRNLGRNASQRGKAVSPDTAEQGTGSQQVGSISGGQGHALLLRVRPGCWTGSQFASRSADRRSHIHAPLLDDAQSSGTAVLGLEEPIEMATRDEIADALSGMTLFADLATPQLLGVASRFEEAFFAEGSRVLRQGLTGSAFYVILEGEAAVIVDGDQRATLGRGEFFGEVSVLLGDPPTADVVALRPLRCVVLAGSAVEAFLIEHPKVTYRMLQAQSRRLRNANRARG